MPSLRAWERRYGFPAPERNDGTHRRYGADEIEAIRRVVAARQAGYSLGVAIERAREQSQPRSIYSALRDAAPELAPRRVSRTTMLAVSRAIEDECCARAAAPFLLAAFQEPKAYEPARSRWQELSRTATDAIVLATFEASHRRRNGPTEVAISRRSPLVREWAVICDAPGASACLVGWETTHDQRDVRPRFEAVWSVEPRVVRAAALAGLTLARTAAPDLRLPLTADVAAVPLDRFDPARLVALTDRIIGNLDRAAARGRRPSPSGDQLI